MKLIENLSLFPQNLYKIDCKNNFDYLLKESYVIKEKYKNVYHTPKLMYASENRDIFKTEPSFFPLKNFIKKVLHDIHPKIKTNIIHSWINFSYKHNYQKQHVHPCNMAGVYYINYPPNSGEILIHNQYLDTEAYGITPYKGLMILFNGKQPHSVLKNFSNNPRIALPFNIIFQ
tara:strand:+ start:281 stop:802 length:522 start_codon:yes stop_codon:yes gene_type:complete